MSKRRKRTRTAKRRHEGDEYRAARPAAGDGLRVVAAALPALLRHAEDQPGASGLRPAVADQLRALQRSHGNRYVQALVARQQEGGAAAAAPASRERAQELFYKAMGLYERRRYQQAFDLFQQVSEMPGLTDEIRSDCRYNIGRTLFEQGKTFFDSRQYARAIIRFERLRQLGMPEVGEQIADELVWNIAVCNFKLQRYNTAIVYLEEYRDMSGVGAEDRAGAEALLVRVKRLAGVPQEEGPAPVDRQREMFQQAQDLFSGGRFRRAIVRFERVRQLPGISAEVARDCLWNIGVCNLRLRRFATAIIYFERYMKMSGADLEGARAHLREAKLGAGVIQAAE